MDVQSPTIPDPVLLIYYIMYIQYKYDLVIHSEKRSLLVPLNQAFNVPILMKAYQ